MPADRHSILKLPDFSKPWPLRAKLQVLLSSRCVQQIAVMQQCTTAKSVTALLSVLLCVGVGVSLCVCLSLCVSVSVCVLLTLLASVLCSVRATAQVVTVSQQSVWLPPGCGSQGRSGEAGAPDEGQHATAAGPTAGPDPGEGSSEPTVEITATESARTNFPGDHSTTPVMCVSACIQAHL